MKYAFALFLNHDFAKSLEVTDMGLKKNPRHAALNRLAMYNYTDLKRFEEAMKAADLFFNACDRADYSYLDYMYYGHLLENLEKYDEAVAQYEKALTLDPSKTDLYQNISTACEQKNDYEKAKSAYQRYYASLGKEEQTPDLQFQLGRLYYGAGTQPDSLAITPTSANRRWRLPIRCFKPLPPQRPTITWVTSGVRVPTPPSIPKPHKDWQNPSTKRLPPCSKARTTPATTPP